MSYIDMYRNAIKAREAAECYYNNSDFEHMDSAILNLEATSMRVDAMLSAIRANYKISKEAENELMQFEQEEEERETIVDLVKKVLVKKGVKKHAGLV